MRILVALLCAVPWPARADEGEELAASRAWALPRGWSLAADAWGGILGTAKDSFDSNSILRPSPYVAVELKAALSGPVESLAMAAVGYSHLATAKRFADPRDPQALLPARFFQNFLAGSAYADLGKLCSISGTVKSAVYAALDGFGMGAPSQGATGLGLANANAGVVFGAAAGAGKAALGADAKLEAAQKDKYSNLNITAVPSGALFADYEKGRFRSGAEATLSRADLGLRPYVGYRNGKDSAVVAGEVRRSRNPFFPDSLGAGVEGETSLTKNAAFGLRGHVSEERYFMDPRPSMAVRVEGTLSWSWAGLRGSAGRSAGSGGGRRAFSPGEVIPLNARVPSSGYAAAFRAALEKSPSLDAFVRSVPAAGTDDILAAVSAFTTAFGANNYNDNELARRNVENPDELYARARASTLNGGSDPLLVCIGSSQFAADLAERLGRRLGIPIKASAVSVMVPDEKGRGEGHAVAIIKTPEYGIVLVDWGWLTPTRTQNTAEALSLYQALAGVPAVFHDVTEADRDGSHVGYLYSEEGKLFLRDLAVHHSLPASPAGRIFNDAPDGRSAAMERYRSLLLKALSDS